jgi:heme/copper-type cytochrome/quinol oxidase subunit 2
MDKLKKVIAVMAMAMIAVYTTAQETVNTTNVATDLMKSNGKIYLVMTVVTIIVIGLLLYVMRVDRKISKLEKKG